MYYSAYKKEKNSKFGEQKSDSSYSDKQSMSSDTTYQSSYTNPQSLKKPKYKTQEVLLQEIGERLHELNQID